MDFWGAGGGRNRISEFGRDEKFLKSVRRWNKKRPRLKYWKRPGALYLLMKQIYLIRGV